MATASEPVDGTNIEGLTGWAVPRHGWKMQKKGTEQGQVLQRLDVASRYVQLSVFGFLNVRTRSWILEV